MAQSIENNKITISIAILIALLLFIIIQTSSVSSWKTDMENTDKYIIDRQDNVDNALYSIIEQDKLKQTNDVNQDINLAKINVKLENIEEIVTDIKKKLE